MSNVSEPTYYFVSYSLRYDADKPDHIGNDIAICDGVLPIREFERIISNRYGVYSASVISFQVVNKAFADQNGAHRPLINFLRPDFSIRLNIDKEASR